ncbi:diphosphate--fructose-6-phosphate 1-phosphotransferase [Ammoniphilus sp. CFH 90114]|uniref:diphosphate--fructose-6-phosphate 1-phosphotransferase n=1 Tax=Ammoniphilus sp. CFH 90114 TaxID=2493665 RepID=UPI00100E292C|nr:diphosphate--fructose-6-phosphate 1-phosphotransferase [Ammoniphilus sp. CFH 90114]RXT07024.1 diphosphate--fructose-6-phosphate 1-phosphotransferase [Ammoniphilus sp. CFH 90114]
MPNKMKIAIAQAGGPTAVINSSLYGFLKGFSHCDNVQVYGIYGGIAGLIDGRFIHLNHRAVGEYEWLQNVPGAALGAGRKPLSEQDIGRIILQLKEKGVSALAIVGGNGTMWSCNQIAETAREMGYNLQVIGIPKTVDNDLVETDHTPGYGSAARFVAHAVRDLAFDLESMKNFENVRVVETMGRNVGWLAASSTYFRNSPDDAPHIVCLPEIPFNMDQFLESVNKVHRRLGYAIVVVSEGLKDKHGNSVSEIELSKSRDHKVLGGVGGLVSERITTELGLSSRYENLGILQRCTHFMVSNQDRLEARMVGEKAAEALLEGKSDIMIGLQRGLGHAMTSSEVPLSRVVNQERSLESQFISDDNFVPIASSFKEWLYPIIGETCEYGRMEMRPHVKAIGDMK